MRASANRAHLEWLPGRQTIPLAADRWQSADDLRLLAAHDLRHAGRVAVGQARDELDHGARTKPRRSGDGGDLGRSGGAGDVGRFDPALTAADHAGEQHAAFARRQPGADLVSQHAGEAAAVESGMMPRGRLAAAPGSRRPSPRRNARKLLVPQSTPIIGAISGHGQRNRASETWAATTRQPSGVRIQVCICRPVLPLSRRR